MRAALEAVALLVSWGGCPGCDVWLINKWLGELWSLTSPQIHEKAGAPDESLVTETPVVRLGPFGLFSGVCLCPLLLQRDRPVLSRNRVRCCRHRAFRGYGMESPTPHRPRSSPENFGWLRLKNLQVFLQSRYFRGRIRMIHGFCLKRAPILCTRIGIPSKTFFVVEETKFSSVSYHHFRILVYDLSTRSAAQSVSLNFRGPGQFPIRISRSNIYATICRHSLEYTSAST